MRSNSNMHSCGFSFPPSMRLFTLLIYILSCIQIRKGFSTRGTKQTAASLKYPPFHPCLVEINNMDRIQDHSFVNIIISNIRVQDKKLPYWINVCVMLKRTGQRFYRAKKFSVKTQVREGIVDFCKQIDEEFLANGLNLFPQGMCLKRTLI